MRRLVPLLGAVLALALSGTAAADTFRVAHSHTSGGAIQFTTGAPTGAVAFTATQSEPARFAELRGIWQAAGAAYGIPWEVLAAINKVESDFGRNLGPSSAGAIGWMQFMPSTWARWGVDANGDGVADPNNPTDAIFSAARYLAACGGQTNISAAIYCYNHANWYVNDVLGLAAVYGRGGGGSGFASFNPLQSQLDAASKQIARAKNEIASARARARTLAGAVRRAMHVVNTAPLLSDQLAAQKRATLLGLRRDAVLTRLARLRKVLESAKSRLSNPVLSTPIYVGGGIFGDSAQGAPYSGVVSIAMQYLGVPYLWGGTTPAGFDCSGLVKYVFAQVGVSLPHYTVSQWNSPDAVSVPLSQLEPGDLVFFNGLDHVGIYIGGGEFIDSPHTGAAVRIDSLSERWYATRYNGAKRIVGAQVGSFEPNSGGAVSFTTTGDGTAFTPNVVYFTH